MMKAHSELRTVWLKSAQYHDLGTSNEALALQRKRILDLHKVSNAVICLLHGVCLS